MPTVDLFVRHLLTMTLMLELACEIQAQAIMCVVHNLKSMRHVLSCLVTLFASPLHLHWCWISCNKSICPACSTEASLSTDYLHDYIQVLSSYFYHLPGIQLCLS